MRPATTSLIAVEEAPDEELQALADLNLSDRSSASDAPGRNEPAPADARTRG